MTEALPDTGLLRAKATALLMQARQQAGHLQRAIGMTSGDPALRSRLDAAAAHLAGVAATLSHALDAPSFAMQSADLVAIEGAVQTGDTGALVAEASAAQTHAAATLRVASASVATRQEVQSLSHDLFERHIFDNYLYFSSQADEAEFRQHEAASRSYIHDQLARGTPEGDLNAGGGTLGYMLDAHAHGAGNSPDFLPKWNALAEKTQRQHAAMRAAGQSTAEYDRHVEDAARRLLREEKNFSDAEIDRILASQADPLEAVKPFLKKDGGDRGQAAGADHSRQPVALAHDALPEVVASPGAAIPVAPAPPPLDAMTARLKAAGVRLTDTGESAPAHGVAVPKPAAKPGLSAGG